MLSWRRGVYATLLLIITSAGLLLTSCATYRGVAEFELYRSAFEKSYAASSSIIDQLSVQERALFLRHYPPSNVIFNPNLAAYYTDTVDPPGTAAFRRALDTVKTYNDLIYGLASGEFVDALDAKVSALSSQTISAGSETANLLGLAKRIGLGDLLKVAGSLNGYFAAAMEILDVGLKAQSRADFRRFVLKYNDNARNILLELRAGTAKIFPILTAETLRRSRIDPVNTKLTAQEAAKIDAYRKLLADWVILIDATVGALDHVTAASTADVTFSGSITSLTMSAVELEAAAKSARKHLAELGAT